MAERTDHKPRRLLFIAASISALVGAGVQAGQSRAHFPNYCGHTYIRDGFSWDQFDYHTNSAGAPLSTGRYHHVTSYVKLPNGLWQNVHWHNRKCHA